MKILFLTNLLSPYRVEWINLLSTEHEIHAYYLIDSESTREQAWLESCRPLFASSPVGRSRVMPALASRAFTAGIMDEGFDIALIDGYSSPVDLQLIRKLKKKCRLFINIDGIDIWKPRSKSDIFKDVIKRRVFRSGAEFLCGSHIAAQAVVDGGADPAKVHVHPFTSLHEADLISYDDKAVLQREYKEKLGLGSKKIALAVGRFIPLKKYDVLIRAWKDMPGDCALYIIGGGEERPRYEELIQREDISGVHILDFLTPDVLSGWFCAADVFVHTSSTETWGLVLNEAMAKCCPVIATDRCVGAVELITQGREGYITAVGDADDLHRRMAEVLGDDALRAKMAKNARERITPFTYENLAAVHLEIFREGAK